MYKDGCAFLHYIKVALGVNKPQTRTMEIEYSSLALGG
tara:strand:- start:4956 stop:5069 length:114 start_codon:yes stop_codon:yes gene_type:complete